MNFSLCTNSNFFAMSSTEFDTNVSLYENTLKFYFVQIGDNAAEEIKFAREVSALVQVMR